LPLNQGGAISQVNGQQAYHLRASIIAGCKKAKCWPFRRWAANKHIISEQV
jgi:hypothetical protein